MHICGCLFVTQQLKSGPNGTWGVHEEPKCHELVKEHSSNSSLVFLELDLIVNVFIFTYLWKELKELNDFSCMK